MGFFSFEIQLLYGVLKSYISPVGNLFILFKSIFMQRLNVLHNLKCIYVSAMSSVRLLAALILLVPVYVFCLQCAICPFKIDEPHNLECPNETCTGDVCSIGQSMKFQIKLHTLQLVILIELLDLGQY